MNFILLSIVEEYFDINRERRFGLIKRRVGSKDTIGEEKGSIKEKNVVGVMRLWWVLCSDDECIVKDNMSEAGD